MVDTKAKIRVSKIDAAKRQLHVAIELWFREADIVSTHTLARAAYDIIHDLNVHSGMPLDLLYNSDQIKEEHQTEWATKLRDPGNFAKHAKRDPASEMTYSSEKNLGFIIFAIRGLSALGEAPTVHITSLTVWLAIHNSEFIEPESAKSLIDRLPVEHLADLRNASKNKFLETFLQIAAGGAAR
jgi:hypothetical protein